MFTKWFFLSEQKQKQTQDVEIVVGLEQNGLGGNGADPGIESGPEGVLEVEVLDLHFKDLRQFKGRGQGIC